MNSQKTKRMLSMLLAVVLVIGLLPATVLAAPVKLPDSMPLVSDKESTLAPGVTLHEIVAYSGDGERVEMYATIADLSLDTVQVFANYKDNKVNEGWGFQTPADQAAAFEANHPGMQVVAATNGSYYNLTSGEPEGVLVMEGVQAVKANDDSNNYPFFAIMKDGTPYIGQAWTFNGVKDNVKEAISGKRLLVWDGKACDLNGQYDYNDPNYKYPRNAVGVTADGKVVMLLADGYRSPYSDGTTLDELAALMVQLGCVGAVQLDGGGSSSLSTKPEGADKLELTSTPGDGGFARKVANTLVVVSTASASDTFHHAALTAEHDYVTPNSTVGITVTGVSATGHNAELPADTALQVKDAAMGSIADGKYVAKEGFTGDAVVQAVSGGQVVGETTIHVVIPTAVNFVGEKLVVKYGNTADLVIEATVNDGLIPVTIKNSDFKFTWSGDVLGTVEGFSFVSSEDTALTAASTLTATLVHDNTVLDTIEVRLTDLPDAPVVVADFEDQVGYRISSSSAESDWLDKSYGIVDASAGKVHSGKYAFKYALSPNTAGDIPVPQGYWSHGFRMGNPADSTKYSYSAGQNAHVFLQGKDFAAVDLTNAATFGFWMYLPEDTYQNFIQIPLINSTNGEKVVWNPYQLAYTFSEEGHTGWTYFELDFEALNAAQNKTLNDGNWYIEGLYVSCGARRPDQMNNGAGYDFGYEPAGHQSQSGYVEYFFDDFTVEYIELDVDRADPDFGTMTMSYGETTDAEVKGQTITSNEVSFAVQAIDESKLDAAAAKAYIDGNAVAVTCDANGTMTINTQTLADGAHNITFVATDVYGNTDYITRQVVVDADSDIPTVTIKANANNAADDQLKLGGVYWLDVEVDNIENVDSISMNLNLDACSDWELQGMEVPYGFTAKYSIDSTNNSANITITKTGEVELAGHQVIAKIPARAWYYQHGKMTPIGAITANGGWWNPFDVRVQCDRGLVTYDDGTKTTFSMANVDCDTELYDWYYVMQQLGRIPEGNTHSHAAAAIADKAATCTEDGYTGRTFCEGCNSVVNWGTKKAATGHDYVMRSNGVVECNNKDCDKLFSGVFTDGKTYKDGAAVEGWVEETYYVDGELITGIYAVEDVYYDFGEDGVNKGKVTGLFVDPADNHYSYALAGVLKTGWVLVDTDWHYFDENGDAVSGKVAATDGIKFVFEKDGKLTEGVWVKSDAGSRYYYGPDFYKAAGTNSYSKWAFYTIDGKEYCFDTDGYRLEGIQWITQSNDRDRIWYDFGTNGVAKKFDYTGPYTHNGELTFIFDGVTPYNKGLFVHEGNYYNLTSTYVLSTGLYNVVYPNDLVKQGKYNFTDDGKMVVDGITYWASELCYLVNGVPTAAGVIYDEAEDCFYYARTGGKIQFGEYKVPANRTNGLIPAGTYDFGEDGKLANTCENLGHKWEDATCTTAKTCSVCEATEGEAVGHKWVDATCTAPKTCSVCEATEGSVIAHTWVGADCDTAKTCSVCEATEGTPLGHIDENNDHKCDRECGLNNMGACVDVIGDKDHKCDMCGKENITDHVFFDATCILPKLCIDCGLTEGEALGHKDENKDHDCDVCGKEDVTEHDYADATCTEPKTCTICGATEGEALGHKDENKDHNCDVCEKEGISEHTYADATCTEPKTCTICGATEGEALGHELGDWVITKEPTTDAEGEKIRTCQREGCEYEETETIAKLEQNDGWAKEDGKWYYYEEGEKLTSDWLKDNGKWYYLDEDGVMTTGWIKVDGKWYLMSANGQMLTGWQKVSGKWYYLQTEMKTGWQKVSGVWYYLDASGAMQTGWEKVGGNWYYLNNNGVMQTYWEQVDGKWYYLAGDGAMRSGWLKIDGNWYLLKNDMKTGWQKVSGKWYYMNESGAMVTGTQTIDGKTYEFNANGAWIG